MNAGDDIDIEALFGERDRLKAALRMVIDTHDDVHAESCRAYGYGNDGDLPEDPSDADPQCTCGLTDVRNRARGALSPGGTPTWQCAQCGACAPCGQYPDGPCPSPGVAPYYDHAMMVSEQRGHGR